MTTTENDLIVRVRPEVEHLLDLLDLLPDEQTTDFWSQLVDAEQPVGTSGDYFVSKMRMLVGQLQRALTREHVAAHQLEHAVQYLLMFFDRSDAELYRVLDRVAGYGAEPAGRTGRRWMEDVCATAWRIYVPCRAMQRRDRDDDDSE